MEDSLHYTLLAAHTLFQKRFLLRLMREYPGLLPGQPKVIDFLMSHPASFQREIAEGCLIEPATLSPILEKMESAGLIRREKADGNRKNSIVSLTGRGQETGRKLRDLFHQTEDEACEGLSEEQKENLLRNLRHVQNNCRRNFQ